jgi:hypothetical protein
MKTTSLPFAPLGARVTLVCDARRIGGTVHKVCSGTVAKVTAKRVLIENEHGNKAWADHAGNPIEKSDLPRHWDREALAVATQQAPAKANIGLAPSSRVPGSEPLTVEKVAAACKALGIGFRKVRLAQSASEPTLVCHLSPLDEEKALSLSLSLRQDCIAYRDSKGRGHLVGPYAAQWGAFNPDFFLE